MNFQMSSNVVVVGAGIAGLTTAFVLAKNNYKVIVVARHQPGDLSIEYTSPWAGGNWHSFAKKDEIILQNYDKRTYLEFLQLARKIPEAGIVIQTANVQYHKCELKNCNKEDLIPWFKTFVEDFKELENDKLPPGIVYGYSFTSFVISTTRFMFYLIGECAKLGVRFRSATLNHILEARKFISDPIAIFNCTGLLARELGGVKDEKLYPIFGQTVLIRNKTNLMIHHFGVEDHDDECLYIMPRVEGTTILGGCFRKNDWSENVDKQLSDRIIARAIDACPELLEDGPIDIISHNVGRRPARIGGPRVETEYLDGHLLVHNYGAGAAGFQSSVGMAESAFDLFKNEISRKKEQH